MHDTIRTGRQVKAAAVLTARDAHPPAPHAAEKPDSVIGPEGPRRIVRLALVGAGLIARQSHLPAALATEGVEIAAIIDPVVARAQRLAADFSLSCRVAPGLRSVFGRVDAAIIATPNDSHAPLALACIENGMHVLVEKPLASTVGEAEAIVVAARERGVALAVGYVTRFRSTTLLLKRLLDQQYFGKVKRFLHQFGTVGGWSPLSAYNLGRTAASGGVLVMTGTHFLDRMLHFWGAPDDVELEDDSLGGPEANCRAGFAYRQLGLEGCARYSKTFRLRGGLVIEAERGTVVVDDHDGADIRFLPAAGHGVELVVRDSTTPPGQEEDIFQRQLEDFADAVRSCRAPKVDGAQGLLSMKLIDRLYTHRRPMAEPWRRGRA